MTTLDRLWDKLSAEVETATGGGLSQLAYAIAAIAEARRKEYAYDVSRTMQVDPNEAIDVTLPGVDPDAL